jgi:hypothetical protein
MGSSVNPVMVLFDGKGAVLSPIDEQALPSARGTDAAKAAPIKAGTTMKKFILFFLLDLIVGKMLSKSK